MLLNIDIHLETGHKPLQSISKKPLASALKRLQRIFACRNFDLQICIANSRLFVAYVNAENIQDRTTYLPYYFYYLLLVGSTFNHTNFQL